MKELQDRLQEVEQARENHVDKINAVIDAIINLEEYYYCLPNDLVMALNKARKLRNLAEEQIEVGDMVYDSEYGKDVIVLEIDGASFVVAVCSAIHDKGTVSKTHAVIDYLAHTKHYVYQKYCFKRHY